MSDQLPDPWNHPDNVRARVQRIEARRVANPASAAPVLPRSAGHHMRARTIRPPMVAIFVALTAVTLLVSLSWLAMFASQGSFCIQRGTHQECGTFGHLMESLTLVPAVVWTSGLLLAVGYHASMIIGVWTMRRWGWWLAVGSLVFNFAWSMCDMGIRVFVIWTLSGLLLLWFARNKQRFTGPHDARLP